MEKLKYFKCQLLPIISFYNFKYFKLLILSYINCLKEAQLFLKLKKHSY